MTIKKLIFFERSLVVLNVVGSSPTLHPHQKTSGNSLNKGFPLLFYNRIKCGKSHKSTS